MDVRPGLHVTVLGGLVTMACAAVLAAGTSLSARWSDASWDSARWSSARWSADSW
jgi:hypothetical protein